MVIYSDAECSVKSKGEVMKYLLFLLSFTLYSCQLEPEEDEDDFDLGTTSFSSSCNYSGYLTFRISSDVTNDFDETSVSYTNTVSSSTCSGVYVGDSRSSSYDRIVRSGTGLTFTNNGYTYSYTISGNSFTIPSDETTTISGVTYNFTYSDTLINSSSDELSFKYNVAATSSSIPLSTRSATAKSATQNNTLFIPFPVDSL